MLTREVMGVLALGILWINTLLVIGAALGPLRELLALLGRARRCGVLHGRAKAARGQGFAVHSVEQVGRRASDDRAHRAILFHDRAFASRLLGGTLAMDGAELTVGDSGACQVWVSRSAQERAGACDSPDAFAAAYREACRAKGFVRSLETTIADGDEVWMVGARQAERIVPVDGELLVASFDPRPWLVRRVLAVIGFQVAMAFGAALVTALALTPPLFGPVSTAGGVLGLAFFLGVLQPLGPRVRDAVRPPSRAFVRGSWIEPQACSG